MKILKRTHPLISIFFIILILLSCSGKKNETEEVIKSRPEVIVSAPIHQKMVDYLTFNGNTFFLGYEVIRATFSGYIEHVNKNLGDKVEIGENIYSIKTKESSALDSSNFISTDVKFKGLVKINAKTKGALIKMFYHTGDYVMEGEQLALLAAPQSLRISLNVPYINMNLIRKASNFIIELPDGRHFIARIGNIMPSVDQVNQTQRVLLAFENEEYIPDSLNVTVMLQKNAFNDAMVLPKSALQTDETQSAFWIMKVINDSIAVKVVIKKGVENAQYVQIVEPQLNQGDKFIVDGAYGLEDSTKVRIAKK